ncbi:MAG TPA: choice-of-anchor E domain-containing protein [Xanthobacteraceae bacterium]|nr:choice-of-anchor E domain-containing protein [Xanthobacteraceae bacterium]
MIRVRTVGLTAAAMMACASVASAGTITQTVTFGPAATNWTHTFSFTGFNSALGTLTKVSDTITDVLAGTVNVTNNGASSATFSAHLTNTGSKTFPGLTVSALDVSSTASGTLAPGASSGSVPLSGTASSTGTTTSGLASYEVATVNAVATDRGSLTLGSSTGDASATFTDTGEIIDKLVYTYSSTPVPEPGALVLLGSGLAFLGFVRRRKRTE